MTTWRMNDLEGMNPGDLFALIEGISDEQAVHSDVDGDSDADDQDINSGSLSISTRSTPNTSEHGSEYDSESLPSTSGTRFTASPSNTPSSNNRRSLRKHKKSLLKNALLSEMYDEPYDSDDSVKDKNYSPNGDMSSESDTAEYLEMSNARRSLKRKLRGNMKSYGSEVQYQEAEDVEVSDETESHEIEQPVLTWNKASTNPTKFSDFNFNGNFGSNIEVDISSPIEIFHNYFSVEILEHIIKQTNLYARQKKKNLDIDTEELEAFFGILIIMGFHKLPSLRMYWSADENLHVRRVSDIMSQKRFLTILRFLHLNDNEKMPARGSSEFDKLYKIRPLVDHLNTRFIESFNPSRNMAVDESMVGFKGRSVLKQYMPLKPTKRGFKIWALACSSSKYLLKFKIYEGRSRDNKYEGLLLGEKTVLELCEPFLDKGYCIYFDNFFSSFQLLTKLLERDTFACGTFRTTRKNYPKDILADDKALKTGDSDHAMSGDLSVAKWKDRGKKSVVVISSIHNPTEKKNVLRTNKSGNRESVNCPSSIYDYNQHMGGVDGFDQLMASYSMEWKSRKWWIKLFYWLLDASVTNAYIIYKTTLIKKNPHDKAMSHLNFRSILSNQLIGDFTSRKRRGPQISTTAKKLMKDSGRSISIQGTMKKGDVGKHIPVEGTWRRCAKCSTKKKQVRSKIMCQECKVALCLACFKDFHNN